MTSSSRLSYFGVQIAVAFCLVNLSDFAVQTSLVPARDRVIGILLGLLMMWLVFDPFWSVSAAEQMKRTFASNLRLMAEFAREPISDDVRTATARSYSLRETINSNFDRIRDLTGGVLLEFGPSRERDLALRERIIRWQAQLRLLFVHEIALWKYRAQLPGFELAQPLVVEQRGLDNNLSLMLESMAERTEKQSPPGHAKLEGWMSQLERAVNSYHLEEPRETFIARSRAMLFLDSRIESLMTSLNEEI